MRASSSCKDNLSDEKGRQIVLAGFYALHLRHQGYSVAEAARLVILRYPAARPQIERLTREVVDPLAPFETTSAVAAPQGATP